MNGVRVSQSSGRCRFTEPNADPSECPEPAVYTIEFPECPTCYRMGWLFCSGHPACLDHGAGIRADKYVWAFGDGEPDDGQDVTVARISAVYREAS